jgi:plasmid maintenance system antidote protein VapI
VLREDVLPATALSVSELARLLNTTPEMWLNMQRAVDLWQERRRLANELASIEPVAA